MLAALVSCDQMMASLMPPLLRIMFWGALSGIVSMTLYALLSPQERLKVLKTNQKAVRHELMRYDGEWAGMKSLIAHDLGLSLRQIGMILLPFAVSVGPVIALVWYLPEIYPGAYSNFGPDWMRGFEFWYFLVFLIVSLFIKIRYKIA